MFFILDNWCWYQYFCIIQNTN